jgi:cysteine synthase A
VSPDFISKLTGDAVAAGHVDGIVPVSGADSIRLARELARREGVFVGISSGATLAAAMRLAERAPVGSTMLCMLADTGERYLSTPLFDEAAADMSPAELELSRSTPSARFDAPSPAPPPAPASVADVVPALDAEAEAFVDAAIADPGQPIVMFALEWCEFCWSVRKFFKALGVPYRAIEIDGAALAANDMGLRVRRVLQRRNGVATIPQVFVGGTYVGGSTDVLDAYRDGTLQAALAATGIAVGALPDIDAHSFLPAWLHPTQDAAPSVAP